MAEYPTTPFDPAGEPEWRELEQRLQGLAGQVRFPPTPDLAGATRRLLSERHAPAASPSPERLAGRWPRLAIAAAILILIAAAVLAVSSPARDAVARWLDIPGIRLLVDEDASPDEPAGTLRSWLGTPAPLESMQDQVAFRIAVPQADGLGNPDESYLLVDNGMPIVTMIYLEARDLPPIPGSDVGVLIMQFSADVDSVWIQKQLNEGTRMDIVQVNGIDALWIEGTHMLSVLPDMATTPATRSSANVLLWNQNGVTYRIEARLPRSSLIEIAESMQPISP